jgi:hypothetical protein
MELANPPHIINMPFVSKGVIQGCFYRRCFPERRTRLQESPHIAGIMEFEYFIHRRSGKAKTAASETIIRKDQTRPSNATRNGSAPSRY